MSTQRRAYFRPNGEFLLMVYDDGWIPHMQTLSDWRAGRVRIYMPDAATVITMPGRKRWHVMSEMEATRIRAVIDGYWIPDGVAYEGIPEESLDEIDVRISTAEDPELARPSLIWDAHPLDLTFIPQPHPQPQQKPLHRPLPPHVVRLIMENAVATKALCPITLTPIRFKDATVTPCEHVFNADALRSWTSVGRRICPECRGPLDP